MIAIDEKYLLQLKNAGLYVSGPFPEGHIWKYGIRVAKPTSTAGNSIPDYHFTCGSVPIDAPALVLYPSNGKWVVLAQESVPSPGPGDFENKWSNLQEAVDDVLDFYLGDPQRMSKLA